MTEPFRPRITYEDGDGFHRRRLEPGQWVIGRDADCDIVVKDFGLSRRHARLVVDERAVHIADLQSKGGTQVNAVVVQAARLANGDHVLLGHFPLRFFDTSEGGFPEGVDRSAEAKPGPEPACPPGLTEVVPPGAEESPAPRAWQRAAPDSLALIRRIAALKGRPPDSLDEHSALRELGDSLPAILYIVTTIARECAVELPMRALERLHTVGELVELIRRTPKIKGA